MVEVIEVGGVGMKTMIATLVEDAVRVEVEKILRGIPGSKGFLTRSETALMLGVSLMTLYRMDKEGVLKPRRICRKLRYSVEDVNNLIERGR